MSQYFAIPQSDIEVSDLANSPAISMSEYLARSSQDQLRNQVSVYAERGDSRRRLRILYMNEIALKIWTEMGKIAVTEEARHRPPVSAQLVFGVPFSD